MDCALTGLAILASLSGTPDSKTPPLMRGTLWWVTQQVYGDWGREEFETEIQAQRDVGFDVLWIFNTPGLLKLAAENEAAGKPHDTLEIIFDVADAKGMKVIVDLPVGGWYGKTDAEDMVATLTRHAESMQARYGDHPSLWGWYLNHEINPIEPGDTIETAYWRQVWGNTAARCHAVREGSVVTISPFFLLDKPRRRGFVYLTPRQYADWWGDTLAQTGIDILMLQDSGEHLAFFTLEQREPFFAAVADACHRAGAQFWVNVETGEADVRNWDEFLRLSVEKKVPWRFTPMPWLQRKLELASEYGDSIINWGYYPFMDPDPKPGNDRTDSREAYEAYKVYCESLKRGERD